jgi:hypothetical protein
MPLGVEGLGEKRPSIASRALRLKIARLEAELSLTRLQLEEFELNHEVPVMVAKIESRLAGTKPKRRTITIDKQSTCSKKWILVNC